jgi:hypothetical protein
MSPERSSSRKLPRVSVNVESGDDLYPETTRNAASTGSRPFRRKATLGPMKISKIALSVLPLIVLEIQAAAQVKNLCTLVTIEDARTFFGGTPEKIMGSPQLCAYGSKGQTVKLTIVNYTVSANAKKLFEMNRRGMEEAKGSPKDEPGLGATAFSASTKSTIEIFLLKGNATVQITASTDEHAPIAATLLVKLRDVAKKAAARM